MPNTTSNSTARATNATTPSTSNTTANSSMSYSPPAAKPLQDASSFTKVQAQVAQECGALKAQAACNAERFQLQESLMKEAASFILNPQPIAIPLIAVADSSSAGMMAKDSQAGAKEAVPPGNTKNTTSNAAAASSCSGCTLAGMLASTAAAVALMRLAAL
jgi:hypothetical protein